MNLSDTLREEIELLEADNEKLVAENDALRTALTTIGLQPPVFDDHAQLWARIELARLTLQALEGNRN